MFAVPAVKGGAIFIPEPAIVALWENAKTTRMKCRNHMLNTSAKKTFASAKKNSPGAHLPCQAKWYNGAKKLCRATLALTISAEKVVVWGKKDAPLMTRRKFICLRFRRFSPACTLLSQVLSPV